MPGFHLRHITSNVENHWLKRFQAFFKSNLERSESLIERSKFLSKIETKSIFPTKIFHSENDVFFIKNLTPSRSEVLKKTPTKKPLGFTTISFKEIHVSVNFSLSTFLCVFVLSFVSGISVSKIVFEEVKF